MKKEQLQELCGDSDRPTIAKPFSVQLEGKWWNGATNGSSLVLVETMSPDHVRENAPPIKDLFRSRKKQKPSHTTEMGPLCAWLDDCEMWEKCKDCGGTGTHNCDCFFCDIVEGTMCPVCEGSKGTWAQLPVRIAHVQFNRTLLARYLAPFRDSGIARVFLGKGGLDPFEIQGDGWRVLTMPMNPRDGDKEVLVPTELFQAAK